MAWARRRVEPTWSELAGTLPPVGESSRTELLATRAREQYPAATMHTQIVPYVELLRDRFDAPLYVGLGGRAAIVLVLSRRMRADLRGLGARIERDGARLYLSGQRLGRYGILRAVLELPERELIFETPLTLAHGDVREFLGAAYAGTVELHIGHTHDPWPLQYACSAAGIRPVVAAAITTVAGLAYPTTVEEQAGPAAELAARYPKISDGLSRRTRVRLRVAGRADGVVSVVTAR